MKHLNRWMRLGVIALAMMALGLAACSDSGNGDDGAMADGSGTAMTDGSGTAMADGSGTAMADDMMTDPDTTLELTAKDIEYSTTSLEANAGEVVEVDFTNDGTVEHDFTIDAMAVENVHESGGMAMGDGDMMEGHSVHLHLEPGTDGKIQFTPTEPGTYTFFCTVPGHREAGMEGTITVK